MVGANIRVPSDVLDSAYSDIMDSHGRIQDALSDMNSNLSFLNSDWTGEASLNYRERKIEWEEAMTGMTATLNQIGATLHTQMTNYVDTEEEIRDGWSG